MAKTTATILGVIFLAIGLLGFGAPNMMGMHLTTTHNIILLISGLLALFFGWKGSLQAARGLCYVFGAVFTLVGLIGLLAGGPLLSIIPGQLMFGTADSIVHLIFGVLFLLGGFSTRHAAAATDHRA